MQLLRSAEVGGCAVQMALEGELEPLVAATRPERYGGLAPELVHHLALWHHALARVLPPGAEAEEAWLHALVAWATLASEGTYLCRLAEAVAGDALPATETEAVALGAPVRLLAELEARAVEGAAELSSEASMALTVLTRAPVSLARGAVDNPALTAKIKRVRRAIVDAALGPVQRALDEAQARGAPGEPHLTAMAAAVRVWRFSHRDLELERFVVDHAIPIAWELHNQKRWATLRCLDATVSAVVDALAQRLGQDPELVAYASRVAQMLVFRAQLEGRFEIQLELAERALALCETHRNGRLVCAGLLSERALSRIEAAPLWERQRAALEARVDTRRAEALFPGLERTRRAKEAIAREGVEP